MLTEVILFLNPGLFHLHSIQPIIKASRARGARIVKREETKMTETFELKVRRAGDYRKWEEIPITDTLVSSETTDEVLRGVGAYLRLYIPSAVEIRLNVLGSLQGHYRRV